MNKAWIDWKKSSMAGTLLAFATGFSLASFMTSVTVSGTSMEATLAPGDHILAVDCAGGCTRVTPSGIVIFPSPLSAGEDAYLVKRVVAQGGNRIEIADGLVQIDGTALDEPYIASKLRGDASLPGLTIPPGTVFVMGDNRTASFDSRIFGPVAIEKLRGRALLVWWPLHHMRLL